MPHRRTNIFVVMKLKPEVEVKLCHIVQKRDYRTWAELSTKAGMITLHINSESIIFSVWVKEWYHYVV